MTDKVMTIEGGDIRWPVLSDARVPCVPIFRAQGAGAQAFAKLLEVISDREAIDVFDVLVAELPGNPQPERSAEFDGKLGAIHAVGDESLRVQGIGHVNAVPPVGLNRAVNHVSGLG